MSKKTNDIYEAAVPVKNKSTVNFAFYNEDRVLDNNSGKNYSLEITKRPIWQQLSFK